MYRRRKQRHLCQAAAAQLALHLLVPAQKKTVSVNDSINYWVGESLEEQDFANALDIVGTSYWKMYRVFNRCELEPLTS
jgi:hypothetical protein